MTPRKQILLVEPDAALRAEAEKIMRQAGYEVVSVDSSSRAEGILTVTKFDLAVVGLLVQGKNNTPFYQDWAEDPERAGAPFLLMCAENDVARDLPEEAIVRCPFAPEDLLAKVDVFIGAGTTRKAGASKESATLFGDDAVDGALDKALGLDQIAVEESEIMDATDSSEIKTVAKSESLVGYDAEITSVTSTQKATTDTSKIDLAFIQNKLRDMQPSNEPIPESAKLYVPPPEEPHAAKAKPKQERPAPSEGEHDYEWFASEMQGDVASSSAAFPPKETAAKAKPTKAQSTPTADADSSVFEWSDSPTPVESMTSTFTSQMADAVARRVAERLVKQLNSDKFAQLIKQEIQAYLKNLT